MKFPPEMHEILKAYVYRLIDPRDGSVFYIGKGRANRVFDHVNNVLKLEDDEDEESAKLKKIREIKASGLDPIHIIHRHGMTDEEAYAVEAALIDATPGLTNEVSGRASEYGPAHVSQLITRYQKEVMDVDPSHNLLLINVSNTLEERGVYDAVRYAWAISMDNAKNADYILAISRGVCIDVFVADKWFPALQEHFTSLPYDRPKRIGFVGRLAPESIRSQYKDKRLPEYMMPKKGSRAPVRYFFGRED